MKKCTRCKRIKALNEFNYKSRIRRILSAHCRSCSSLYVRNHYLRNKQYYLDKARKRNLKIKEEVQEYVREYLSSHPCVDCNERDILVLEFDHQRDKISSVSKMTKGYASLDMVKNEVAKCEVRCANCHRRKTALQFGWFKSKLAPVA